jgi:hypothetical protein
MQDAGDTDPPRGFDYNAWLNFISDYGHNFFRTFVWEQARWTVEGSTNDWYYSPSIYQRTGPGNALDGKPKFDLDQFNQVYFDRLRQRVIQAGDRGVYVSLMLFEGFSIDKDGMYPANNPWFGHPFNASNNINAVDGDPPPHTYGHQIQQGNLPEIIDLQEAYVRKVIDTVNDLDNVLFEICNEPADISTEEDWVNHFIDFIHAYEATKPKQHPVGFTSMYTTRSNSYLFASNAEWVSPNTIVEDYANNPPASDGTKVVINDTDHIFGIGGDRVWAWKSFTRGMNVLFMDPYDCSAEWAREWGGGCDPDNPVFISLRENLGYILTYANRINLLVMTPHGELASSGYALANPAASGAEYLVYVPWAGNVTVDLSAASGNLNIEWFNPEDGTTSNGGTTGGGAVRYFTAPFSGDTVLYLYKARATNDSFRRYLPLINFR